MKRTFLFLSNIVSILMLLGILFAYAMFQGGFVSWFLFYSFLPIFLYQIVLLFYPLKKWRVSRELSRLYVEAGETVNVTIRVKRTIPLPLSYCIFREELPDTLNRKDPKQNKYHYINEPEKLFRQRLVKRIVFVGFKKHFNLTYSLHELPRGEHELTQIRIKISDFFGFIKKESYFPVSDILRVHPNEREVLFFVNNGESGLGSKKRRAQLLENTNMITGVRDYAPGDRFSWIHWKQSAKSQRMMTKEFEQEKAANVVLILDASSFEGRNTLVFEAIVEITLSIMSQLERSAIGVDLLVMGSEMMYYSSKNNAKNMEKVRAYLTKLQPSDKESLGVLLEKNRDKLQSISSALLLTSALDEKAIPILKAIKQRSKIAVLYVQSKQLISQKEMERMTELKQTGIMVQQFMEKELTETPLEVNIR